MNIETTTVATVRDSATGDKVIVPDSGVILNGTTFTFTTTVKDADGNPVELKGEGFYAKPTSAGKALRRERSAVIAAYRAKNGGEVEGQTAIDDEGDDA
jgi:hypothetical protein